MNVHRIPDETKAVFSCFKTPNTKFAVIFTGWFIYCVFPEQYVGKKCCV